ncbi:MAG: hypothetical protein IJ246_08225 [Clostridia bacterium]|nr:hypothetical protein [Clostridia bacterium]
MRRRAGWLLVLLLWLLGTVPAQADRLKDIMLYTYYRQSGWGDRVQIGVLDEQGRVWTLSGSDSVLHWPYDTQAQIAFLENCEDFVLREKLGRKSEYSINALSSLVSGVQAEEAKIQSGANDAGVEATWLLRKRRDGDSESVLLGMSGDQVYENTGPDAQALYLAMRTLFPEVVSYAYGSSIMGPQGFIPIPVRDFCRISSQDYARIQCIYDSESGYHEREMTEYEKAWIADVLDRGLVTGKANNISVAGSETSYCFFGRNDQPVGRLDFYGQLLTMGDSMYTITVP